MLRSLLTEIVRRRLWPIPLIAVAVAVGAPLMFLKSAPVSAPPAAAPAPAVAPVGELPARAARLLATSDAGAAGKDRAPARASHDPFTPPAGHRSKGKPAADPAKTEEAKKDSSAAPGTESNPLVVTTADGSVPNSDPAPASPVAGDGTTPSPRTTSSASSETIDVRFGEHVGAKLRREIPRLQTFLAGGKVVAIFVKYSPKRDVAVFEISPTTLVSGDVECRRIKSVCRYVDIPAGSHARLTMLAEDGSLVTRRMDVVRVNHDD